MKFTEEKLESAFIEVAGPGRFPTSFRYFYVPKVDEVLIEEDLQRFLLTQYASHGVTDHEVGFIILQLKSLSASDLYESNKTFLKMLSDGFILKREDRSQKDIYIQLIDYSGLTNIGNQILNNLFQLLLKMMLIIHWTITYTSL